jgi:hypothetical protein
MKTIRGLSLVTAIGVGIALPAVAWASHGKAGLWEITIRSDMGQMQGMPDLSKLPPDARAQILAMSRNGITVRHCMTAADVNNDKPAMSHNQDCKATNTKMNGQTFSVDLVCTGRMNGTGHVQFTFDSPVHYAGSEVMNLTANGHITSHTTNIDAHWVSADCGSVH